MILKKAQAPRVRMPDGEVKSLAQCGLPQLLTQAAREEGYAHWWVAEDLLVGVRVYLIREHAGEVLESTDLERTLMTALRAIGHPEIARRINLTARRNLVCLETLAQEAGPGFELAFWQLLDAALDDVVNSPRPAAHFYRLKVAVLIMLGATRWSPACERLKDLITAKIHHRLAASGRPLQLALTLR